MNAIIYSVAIQVGLRGGIETPEAHSERSIRMKERLKGKGEEIRGKVTGNKAEELKGKARQKAAEAGEKLDPERNEPREEKDRP